MYTYSVLQWLLFFFIYCFFGWVWETLYVSIGQGKWVNRGFMHGPFLPIYGVGCTVMVFITIPIQGNMLFEFVVGMIGATVMEYYTGVVMEKIFHLRYWDYSNQKFNLNGYICLKSSICWGVFAILVPEVLHMKVESFVLSIPETALEIIVVVLTGYIAADFAESFREAMDFKEILVNLAQSNKEIAIIEKRVAAVSDFVNGELKEKSEVGLKKINTTLTEGRIAYQKRTEQVLEIKNKVVASLENIKKQPEDSRGELLMERKSLREELEACLERLNLEERERNFIRNRKMTKRSFRIIQRNPNITSDKYRDALKLLMEYKNDKNEKEESVEE